MVKRKAASTVAGTRPDSITEFIAGWLLTLTVLILPLKLGGLTGVPETTPIYTADPFILLIITWPPLLFPLFAGILLLIALPLTRSNTCPPAGGALRRPLADADRGNHAGGH